MSAPNTPKDLEAVDVALGTRIACHRDKPAVKAAGKASEIADQGPLYAISAGVALWGLISGNRRLGRTGVALLVAVGAADAGKSVTKRFVKRTRPYMLLDKGKYESGAGGAERKPRQSFPSGHMAGSAAFGRALSRTYPKTGALCAVASVGVGWSRMAKGAHWPLDVLAGAVIGLLAEAGVNHVVRACWDKVQGK